MILFVLPEQIHVMSAQVIIVVRWELDLHRPLQVDVIVAPVKLT